MSHDAVASPLPSAVERAEHSARPAWMPVAIAAITVAAFWPVLDNQFVTWGDRADLLTNEHYRGFGLDHLRWMFTTIQMGHYQPLSWITFALDHAVWGMNPRGYHLTSLLLHAACAVAVFVLVGDLVALAVPAVDGRALPWAAAAGALLFALHPLRVETVAWATERRGALSGVLLVVAAILYLRSVATGSRARYWLAVLLFGVSLLAKEVGFTLPAVLLVLDVYPLRRWRTVRDAWRLMAEKIPFLVLAVGGVVAGVLDAWGASVTRSLASYGVGQRLAQCAYGLAFYLAKTALPTGLSPLYPLPMQLDPLAPRFVVSAIVVVLVTLVLVVLRRRRPAGLAAWASAVILLAPVLGLTQSGLQIAADRYTYLPAVGPSALVAGWLVARRSGRARIVSGTLTALVLVALAAATWRQAGVWRNTETLWRHALAVDPTNVFAHNDLGAVLVESNRLDEAADQFEQAVALNPGMLDAQFNLAVIRASQGRIPEAITHLRAVVALNPQDRQAQAGLQRLLAASPEE